MRLLACDLSLCSYTATNLDEYKFAIARVIKVSKGSNWENREYRNNTPVHSSSSLSLFLLI